MIDIYYLLLLLFCLVFNSISPAAQWEVQLGMGEFRKDWVGDI